MLNPPLPSLFASRKHPYVPGLNQPESIQINLSGSILSMQLPPHSDYEGFTADPVQSVADIHHSEQYSTEEHLPEWRRGGASNFSLLKRRWEFRGPIWRGRPYGRISFTTLLMRHDSLPNGMSCLNPAHFEQVVLHSAFNRGPGDPSGPQIKAPMQWRLFPQSSGQSGIYYATHWDFSSQPAQQEYEKAMHHCSLMLPLEHRYYIYINFYYLAYAPAQYSLNAMDTLRDKVLTSIQLDLSESAQQQLNHAKVTWPNAQASQNRPPENWIYPEWRYGDGEKGEDHIVILKPGSPRPQFSP